MKENGLMDKETDMENKNGLTDHATRDNGRMVRLMDKESFIMQMVMYIMEIG